MMTQKNTASCIWSFRPWIQFFDVFLNHICLYIIRERIQNRPPTQLTIGLENRLSGGIYAKQYEYDSKPGAQQLMGVHKVSAFHPFIFQKSGKSTIIRNLAVPRHFVAYLVFISSIRVDPGPRNRGDTTYPRGKHGEIMVHRSSACDKNLKVSDTSGVCLGEAHFLIFLFLS